MSATANSSINLAKTALRNELKQKLGSIGLQERIRQSKAVTDMVINSPEYEQSKRVSIYLSMPEEVGTMDLLAHIFRTGRQCFVPRYTKENMEMLQIYSLEDYKKLPLTKWNIRQPEPDDNLKRPEALISGGLDLIILPGLGFSFNPGTKDWNRLGRGKGYYDKYLEKCMDQVPPPVTIALAFKEQILDFIPAAACDKGIGHVFHA